MTNKFMKVNKDLFTLGLAPLEILILAQVMEFNTNTGDCFISNQTLAAQFGVSEKTVSRAVANLEGKGFLTRTTKNVQKGKERHMSADLAKIETAIFTKDKLSLADEPIEITKDKMTLPEKSNCPLRKGQNDSIKDNSNKINIKDNMEIDEYIPRFARANSSISTTESPEYKEVSKREMLALGVPYEVIDAEKSLYKILATNKIVKAV